MRIGCCAATSGAARSAATTMSSLFILVGVAEHRQAAAESPDTFTTKDTKEHEGIHLYPPGPLRSLAVPCVPSCSFVSFVVDAVVVRRLSGARRSQVRSSRRRILPTGLFGSASRNSTCLGILYPVTF